MGPLFFYSCTSTTPQSHGPRTDPGSPKLAGHRPPNSPAYPAPLVVAARCRAPVAHQGNPATAVYRRIPFPSPPRAPRRNPATFPAERRRKPGCCRTGSTRSRLHVLGRHLRRSAASLLRIQVSFPDSPCVPGIHHQRSRLLDFRLSFFFMRTCLSTCFIKRIKKQHTEVQRTSWGIRWPPRSTNITKKQTTLQPQCRDQGHDLKL